MNILGKQITMALLFVAVSHVEGLIKGAGDNKETTPSPDVDKINEVGRPLTDEEIELGKIYFGDKMDYSVVRLATKGDMDPWGEFLTSLTGEDPIVWGNVIYFPNYKEAGSAGTFLHELTHVYQFQKVGWSYAWNTLSDHIKKFIGIKDKVYSFDMQSKGFHRQFNKLRFEQQAALIKVHYYRSIGHKLIFQKDFNYDQKIADEMLKNAGLLQK